MADEPDDYDPYGTDIDVGAYQPTTFHAEVRSLVVNANGQTKMELLIPPEFKYAAVAVTDQQGKMWEFTASAPKAIGDFDDLEDVLRGWIDG